MKKIILLVLALMVLIGAGVGGYVLFGPKHEEVAESDEPQLPVKPTGVPTFVSIGPLVLPVIRDKRVEQNILLQVSLEVYGDATRESVRQLTPRLNDAFLRALYGGIEAGDVMQGQLVNVNAIRDKLMAASEEVLGVGVVWDVLIQAVTQRPAM